MFVCMVSEHGPKSKGRGEKESRGQRKVRGGREGRGKEGGERGRRHKRRGDRMAGWREREREIFVGSTD